MGKGLNQSRDHVGDHVRTCGLVDAGLVNASPMEAGLIETGRQAPAGGRKLGLIADVDPALDRADLDLRRHEFRWPLVPSIALIVALSAGLWLGIFALLAHITARA